MTPPPVPLAMDVGAGVFLLLVGFVFGIFFTLAVAKALSVTRRGEDEGWEG